MIKANTFLNDEDFLKLLTAPINCHPSQRFQINTFIRILWESGARVSEVCNLKITDFDSRERFITLRNTKNGEDRIIPITPQVDNDIQRLIGGRRTGYIFRGRGESPMGRMSVYQAIQRRVTASKLGKRVTPHSFRHHWITSKIDKGVPLPRIMKFVGHSSLAVTGQYYHFAKEDLRQALDA